MADELVQLRVVRFVDHGSGETPNGSHEVITDQHTHVYMFIDDHWHFGCAVETIAMVPRDTIRANLYLPPKTIWSQTWVECFGEISTIYPQTKHMSHGVSYFVDTSGDPLSAMIALQFPDRKFTTITCLSSDEVAELANFRGTIWGSYIKSGLSTFKCCVYYKAKCADPDHTPIKHVLTTDPYKPWKITNIIVINDARFGVISKNDFNALSIYNFDDNHSDNGLMDLANDTARDHRENLRIVKPESAPEDRL